MFTFRKLTENDFELMYEWLNAEHVITWYTKKNVTLERVIEKYKPYVNGEKPTEPYVILHEDKAIGYIQTYRIDAYKAYSELVGVPNSAGLDLFIGDAQYVHKGYGALAIMDFMAQVICKMEQIEAVVIGPSPNNKVANRAYEKAGFVYLKTFFNKNEDDSEYIMKIDL